jgi:hypothetical protein
VFHTNLGT